MMSAIVLGVLLAVPVKSAYAEALIYLHIENSTLKEIGVIDNNLYYLEESYRSAYVGEQDFYDENAVYTIETYDKFNSLVYNEHDAVSKTAFSFDEKIRTIKIYENSNLIITKEVNFCNRNNKCEPCNYGRDNKNNSKLESCTNFETSLTCPNDCDTGSDDNYCDLAKDGICDLDCEGHDMDCGSCSDPESDKVCYYDTQEYICMYEYKGVSCNHGQKCAQEDANSVVTMNDGTLCCVDSYCISENGSNVLDKTDQDKQAETDEEIEKYVELEKGTEEPAAAMELSKDITNYGIYMLVFVVLAIIVRIIVWLKNRKTNKLKPKSQATSLDLQITQLHAQGMNYSKIKQQMIRKGYHEDEIDQAIEEHFKTKK